MALQTRVRWPHWSIGADGAQAAVPTPTPISPTRPDQLPGDADSVGPGGQSELQIFHKFRWVGVKAHMFIS